jgi:hypothetical protein
MIKSLKRIMNPRGLGLFMCLLLCSCATEKPAHPRLPATVSMNEDAGRGGLLMVVVRLADGEKLPLAVDTGAALTVLDKSLEPKLGSRLDTGTLLNFGVTQDVDVYAAPKLYLGNVPLQITGTNTVTFDRQKLADKGWPSSFMGLIGMNVLRNYCLQLDFAAGKLRFLDDEHADKKNWGRPFPLTDIGDGCFSINENLAGVNGAGSLIDTGCDSSGWLRPALFRQWTNQESSADEKIYSPDGTLGGEMYHELDLRELNARALASDDGHIKFNGLGLRALAENVVTLDFPNRTMYLKHTSDWPLGSRETEAAMKSALKSSIKPLEQLKKRGQLPGVSKADHGEPTAFHFNHDDSPYLDTATWDGLKNGDSSVYHYTFTRAAKQDPWKLQKAWRTDQKGHTMEEYPVP